MKNRIAALLRAAGALSLLACDPSVFEYRLTPASERDAAAADGGVASLAGRGDARAGMSAQIHRSAAPDAGKLTFGAVGSADSAVDAGVASSSAGARPRDAGPQADADSGAVTQPDASTHAPPAAGGDACPRLPSAADESFCYDFESGVNGPNGGDTYDLWPTPQVPIANQLTLVADPDRPQNHVLQTKPSLTASEASAALSHSTHPFQLATVDFDIWVNDALRNASSDVSWFRYVPMDGDETHVTSLIFRRGAAVLRAENQEEQGLTAQPRNDGKPTHVTVQLDRRGPCRTEILLDGVPVASESQNTCAPDRTGFIELGLVMLDRASGELSAYYDNVAFTRR